MSKNNGHIRVSIRRDEKAEREQARAARTPQQQIALLDAKLGIGMGAQKERARLMAQIEGQ